ncbi:uncharacterized protein LOC143020973 [Oratosquilla oratoria]|uniref:uncharacterized protein LOC143020973 n=1 Tax=Oratosquilla oratoria TaxID=337810 RepID=UPI003F776BC7
MEPMVNEICIEEQEEIIVPTKGYNLDLLSAIDNTKFFNPFQTKSTVLNSPHKQEPDLHTKKDLKIEDPSSKPSCSDIIENVTKTHDLDILNELDSNVNPFETKSLDTNSVKDDAILPSDKLDKTDSAAADVLKRSDDESSKTGVQNSHAENDSVSPGEDDIMGEDQDELIVSTKGYDLDAVNFLDDENFNPFQTKSAVVNSPVKENIDQAALVNSKEETVIAKSTQNCIEKGLDTHIDHIEGNGTENAVLKKGLDHCKSKTIQETVNITDKTVIGNESVSDSGTEYCVEGSTVAMEDVPVPGRSYDLNSLDTDFDPFKTRTAVVNSPCTNSQVKKDDTTAIVLQDKAESNNVTENSAKSGHVSESLNELDDPSINPFITKSSVVNSPVKENDITDSNNYYGTTNKMEEIEQSSKKDMPSSCQEMNDENVHKSEEKQNMQFVMEERNQELEFKQNVNTKIGLKTGVSFTGEDDQACVNAEDAESRNTETISTSFDILDYNPFEIKSNVFNSPKREESSLSKPSTIEEESSKDSGAFTVPNNPKSRDCILKDKDKQFHDNPDVYVSSDLGSARTGDKDLLKEGRDSLGTEKAEETEFKNCADFFSNEEELEMLGKAGGHHKVNSIRDSLFIKFDPLVAKRQSLDVRGSCLMSFSPTLSKPFDKEEVMPPKALVTSVANETLIETSVMENSVMEDEGNQTVLSTGKAVNLLELSINNQTVRPVYTEQEMNEALKKQELFLQGASLRQYQEFERKLKAVEKQEEQRTIIITGLEEENKELLLDLENMRKLLMESLRSQKARKVEHTKEVEDIKKRLQEEISMNQETKAQQDLKMKQVQAECDKTESAFFDLVKKYERTQAIVKEQKNNEESMKSCIKDLELKITQMKETFSEILSIHEEKLKQATDYMEETKKAHANEMSKAQVMLKRAEIKIINQKELLERCEKENQRLSAFVDEFTNKFN